MKQYLIVIVMLLTLATTGQAAAQRHRHSSKSTPVANTQTPSPNTNQPDTAGVEAFSDTTSVAEADSLSNQQTTHYNVHYEPDEHFFEMIDNIGTGIAWAVVAICVLIILFVIAPVVIIIAIFYFLNKRRKDKLQLARLAVMHGQPIPEHLLRENRVTPKNIYNDSMRSGIKQVFLGVGLMILLYIILGKLGLGIGALVFFIGLGKLVIAAYDKYNEPKTYDIPYQYTANGQQNPTANEQQTPTDNGTPTPPPYNNEKTEEKEN